MCPSASGPQSDTFVIWATQIHCGSNSVILSTTEAEEETGKRYSRRLLLSNNKNLLEKELFRPFILEKLKILLYFFFVELIASWKLRGNVSGERPSIEC